MSLGIYKQGQGYWVRVLTAALLAVATLGAAGWMAGQAARLEARLPRNSWRLAIDNATGEIAPGQQVVLLAAPDPRGGPPVELGSATVQTFDAASQELVINAVEMKAEGADPSAAKAVSGSAATSPFDARFDVATGIAPIETTLLVGLVVGFVLLLGAVVTYYFTGVKPATCDFLISTDMEMKKVNWSTRREIIGSTWVVIGACVIIAGFLFGIDIIFQGFFRWIGILVDAG